MPKGADGMREWLPETSAEASAAAGDALRRDPALFHDYTPFCRHFGSFRAGRDDRILGLTAQCLGRQSGSAAQFSS